MNKELSKINIENDKLVELLHYSYEIYPRVFLFERNNNKLTNQQLISMLRKITNIKTNTFTIKAIILDSSPVDLIIG